jgi:hypothetical protein
MPAIGKYGSLEKDDIIILRCLEDISSINNMIPVQSGILKAVAFRSAPLE